MNQLLWGRWRMKYAAWRWLQHLTTSKTKKYFFEKNFFFFKEPRKAAWERKWALNEYVFMNQIHPTVSDVFKFIPQISSDPKVTISVLIGN